MNPKVGLLISSYEISKKKIVHGGCLQKKNALVFILAIKLI